MSVGILSHPDHSCLQGAFFLQKVCLQKYRDHQREQKKKQTEEVTSSQEKELAEKDATIRALEEENKTLASELAHLLERNEELKHFTNLDPEREAERKELEVAILKKKLEREQKAISRLTAEVSRERERRRDLMRARDQAIDAICSQLLSIPYSERRLSPLQEANRKKYLNASRSSSGSSYDS
ncbi:rho-associated protein kinase 2-like isoform X1 [Crotalus tigris]|uniref:rho-associated protein kinase 2-like isoform X1 n=1 Tax=Crotalus tigris TaxID=88082 RepID=UPI00192F6BB9|nr:rho-associated protein kinase 2-like isoform X1 [Crotalus tigris]